ncbi:hypothetical protein, partial [Streptomyces albus]
MHEPIDERRRYDKYGQSGEPAVPGARTPPPSPLTTPLGRRAVLGTTGALGAGLALGGGQAVAAQAAHGAGGR